MSSQDTYQPPKILSCSSCRQRKVKCPKDQPVCAQCSRFGLECVYPSRKPTRRAPRPRQKELIERLKRLESIVGSAGGVVPPQQQQQQQHQRALPADDAATADSSSSPGGVVVGGGGGDAVDNKKRHASAGTESSTEHSGPGTNAAARYLSGDFWGNLCEEVEGIRHALDHSSDAEDDDFDMEEPDFFDAGGSSSAKGSSGFMLGNPRHSEVGFLAHPPSDQRFRLWYVYCRNVDPLMKTLHRPTLVRHLESVDDSLMGQGPSPAVDALLFAVYFAAVTTLPPDVCYRKFVQQKEVMGNRFRTCVERSLAAADYLNTTDITVLQAFAIYVAVLRLHNIDRSSWSLTALLVRLAQAVNLHRDGDGHRFIPFEAEMRRRLWHFIMVLDIRAAEDRGTDAIVGFDSYNTAMPTPMDDDDFGPNSVTLTPKTSGPPENVISLCTATCSGVFGYFAHPHTYASGDIDRSMSSEDELLKQVKRLEDSFIHSVDKDNLPSVFASEIARMVILKCWLVIQYPHTVTPTVHRPRLSHETLLRTAVSIIEIHKKMREFPWEHRFAWWTDAYVQWHPLAVALAELCILTEGDLVERAWKLVDEVYLSSKVMIADTSRGKLWTPIRKLLRKARAARADSLIKSLKLDDEPLISPSAFPSSIVQVDTSLAGVPVTTFPDVGTAVTQPFDAIDMDPSYLFQYPPELFGVSLEAGMDAEAIQSPWIDFVNDTMMADSFEDDSGGGSSDPLT